MKVEFCEADLIPFKSYRIIIETIEDAQRLEDIIDSLRAIPLPTGLRSFVNELDSRLNQIRKRYQ